MNHRYWNVFVGLALVVIGLLAVLAKPRREILARGGLLEFLEGTDEALFGVVGVLQSGYEGVFGRVGSRG